MYIEDKSVSRYYLSSWSLDVEWLKGLLSVIYGEINNFNQCNLIEMAYEDVYFNENLVRNIQIQCYFPVNFILHSSSAIPEANVHYLRFRPTSYYLHPPLSF